MLSLKDIAKTASISGITRKDCFILTVSSIVLFGSMSFFLNSNLQVFNVMKMLTRVLSLILYIIFSLNLSLILFTVFSDTQKITKLLRIFQKTDSYRKFVMNLIVVNGLSFINLMLITVSELTSYHEFSIFCTSVSLALWPLIILFILNMDRYFEASNKRNIIKKENTHEFKGIHNAG